MGGRQFQMKTNAVRAISGSLEVRVEGAQYHLGILVPVIEIVC